MKKIAVFASGQGSNFKNILMHPDLGKKYAEIVCLISNKNNIGALDIAREFNIPGQVLSLRDYKDKTAYARALMSCLSEFRAEWIVLAGYLKKIPEEVVAAYPNRIINIHPALLPAFAGKGMYGINVHRAVFNSGAKVSGATVHLVNNDYDRGPVVMQAAVDISGCHSPEEIAGAVLQKEHLLFSEAIIALLSQNFKIAHNRVIFQ